MPVAASGALASHPLWHLALGLLIVAAISLTPALWARRRAATGHRGTRGRASGSLRFVAGASFVAGAVHASVCPEHFRESTAFGVFFVIAALAQMSWAVVVLRNPSRFLLEAGALGQAAVAWLWAVSRSVGVPFGPSPWRREPIGITGVLATAAEIAVAIVAIWLATSEQHAWPQPPGPRSPSRYAGARRGI